ncbi:MAG: hypothetical protein ACO4AG_09725 [Candidatus Nanopelagicales bacterium]
MHANRPPTRRAVLALSAAIAVTVTGAWGAGASSADVSSSISSSAADQPATPSEVAQLRTMIESREVRVSPPTTRGDVGGPISPNFTGTFVKTPFRTATRQALRMPDVTAAPANAAGALIQVTAHSKGAPVSLWTDGTRAPLLDVPRGGVKSTSTVVRWDSPFHLRSSAKADVYVVVHGWILDDPGADIAAGGIGLATKRVTRLDTSQSNGPAWLTRSEGREIQLTGLGGVPTTTSGVVVEAYLEPTTARETALQVGNAGRWRDLTRLESRTPVTQLLVLPLSSDGVITMRSTRALDVRLTPLAWLSAGEAWSAPEASGGFVPIRPDAVNDGRLGRGGVFDIPGIPDVSNVIAAVSGQAFGDGELSISTPGPDGHSVTLPVRGPSTGLLLIPGAQDGARITLRGDLDATVNVVGYVRIAQTGASVARSATDITLVPDITEGEVVNLAETGTLAVRGRATSPLGIQDVAVDLPGYPTFHAQIDHLTGTFTADLRPPAGTHTLTFTATDTEGARSSTTRTITVIAADPYAEILAEGVVSLTPAEVKAITRVSKSTIVAKRPLLDGQGQPVVAGSIVLSAPFAASDEGLSRAITAISVRPAGIVYHTSAPQMGEIFEQASFGVEPEEQRTARYGFSDNVAMNYSLPYTFEKELGSGALTGSVWLNAEAWGQLWVKVVIGSSWFFPQMEFLDVTGDHWFKADAGANVNLDYQRDLYTATPFKSTVMVGPVPVVISVPLRVYLDLQGSAEITAYAEARATWRVLYTQEEWGVDGKKGWRDLEWDLHGGPRWRINGEYDADMKLGIELRPRLTLAEALGVAGPVDFTLLGLKGAGEMVADSDGKREYTCTEPLTLYSDISMGLDFILFADKYKWAIIDKSSVVDLTWWKQSGCDT